MRLFGVIVAVAALFMGIGLQAQTPQELAQSYNLQGMEAYRHFDWKAAEDSFRKALKEDPDNKLVNYNLACVLSLRLSGDRFSWLRKIGPSQDPFDQLARAIQVDPEAAQKAAHDPDFANIRLTPRFQMLIGGDLKDTRLIELILLAQDEWFGGMCGAWCGNDLIFLENGEVTKRVFGEDRDGRGVFHDEHGRYSIDNGVITIQYDSGESIQGGFVTEGPFMGVLQLGRENGYFVYPTGDI